MTQEPFIVEKQPYWVVGADVESRQGEKGHLLPEIVNGKPFDGTPGKLARWLSNHRVISGPLRERVVTRWEAVHGSRWRGRV